MKNSKPRSIFGLGRKWVFTLTLFLFVFALASVVKIQAAGNVTGWLWGGTEDASLVPPAQMGVIDGNETGVGWIKMAGDGASWNGSSCIGTNDYGNNNRCNYGVKIPSTDGLVSGYAWANTSDVPNSSASHEENGLGWIQFDPSGGGVSVTTTAGEKRLSGKARIMSIANAGANAGGWLGWIKMSGDGANWNGSSCEGSNNYNNNNRCNYGVKIDSSGNFSGYAWSDELGWINFSRAKVKICSSMICATKEICEGSSFSSCDSSFCGGGVGVTCAPGGTSWICSNDCGDTKSCSALVRPKVSGKCGAPDGGSFCSFTGGVTDAMLCEDGSPNPGSSSLDIDGYEVTWQCAGSCGGATVSCSARGKRACGWVETNP